MNIRSLLYRLASLLGDINALSKGPTAFLARVVRKEAYKASSKVINRLIK